MQLDNNDFKELGILIGDRKPLFALQNILKPSSSSSEMFIQSQSIQDPKCVESNASLNMSVQQNINFEFIDQQTYSEVK